ncbi:MAG TPA: hypothetical protein PK762_00005 [Candidatus Kapabacteria bacterium]|nr:hypothetical protein [Candidatus Kapabacteria bacterium]
MKLNVLLLALVSFFVISCSSSNEPVKENDNILLLKASQNAVDSAAADLYSTLKISCQTVFDSNFNETVIKNELKSIFSKYPAIAEAVYVNENNIIQYVEPEIYESAIGSDITNQEHQQKMITTHEPAMSGIFKVVEGYYAIVMAVPIISNGQKLGSINLVVKPHEFISFYTNKYLMNLPDSTFKIDDLWVMETNGNIIYDTDPIQTGRNLFIDSLYLQYPELLTAGKKIIAADNGQTYYSFLDKTKQKTVTKDVWWRTSSYYGKVWKFSIVKERGK